MLYVTTDGSFVLLNSLPLSRMSYVEGSWDRDMDFGYSYCLAYLCLGCHVSCTELLFCFVHGLVFPLRTVMFSIW